MSDDLNEYERKAVIFLLVPPESLRDCNDFSRVRSVVWHNREAIIDELARTIVRTWTSEPEDPAATLGVIDNLTQHHRDLLKRQPR